MVRALAVRFAALALVLAACVECQYSLKDEPYTPSVPLVAAGAAGATHADVTLSASPEELSDPRNSRYAGKQNIRLFYRQVGEDSFHRVNDPVTFEPVSAHSSAYPPATLPVYLCTCAPTPPSNQPFVAALLQVREGVEVQEVQARSDDFAGAATCAGFFWLRMGTIRPDTTHHYLPHANTPPLHRPIRLNGCI